ncbi:hypothetical protein RKD23_007543 [Streptomyces sp. SAI-170]
MEGRCRDVTVLGDSAYINTGLIVPHRKRPGWPLLRGEEEDNAQHRRSRVEHTFSRMKNYKIFRDCRQRGDGLEAQPLQPGRRHSGHPHATAGSVVHRHNVSGASRWWSRKSVQLTKAIGVQWLCSPDGLSAELSSSTG